MILLNKQITKVLIRLRGYAGWSAPFYCLHTSKTGFIAYQSGTFATSEDPDEMLQNMAFHKDLHCLLR